MSWWIYLNNKDGKTIELDSPHQHKGGTYAVGGTTEACLNVTYNYGKHFRFHEQLHGKTVAETLPILKGKIAELKDDATNNYWDDSEGNVKECLRSLVSLAKLAPHGRWYVS